MKSNKKPYSPEEKLELSVKALQLLYTSSFKAASIYEADGNNEKASECIAEMNAYFRAIQILNPESDSYLDHILVIMEKKDIL